MWKQIGSSALVGDSMFKAKVKLMAARGGIEPPAADFHPRRSPIEGNPTRRDWAIPAHLACVALPGRASRA